MSKSKITIIGIISALLVVVAFFCFSYFTKPKNYNLEKPISSADTETNKTPTEEETEKEPEEQPEKEPEKTYTLSVTSPKSTSVSTTESSFSFAGSCEPNSKITINNQEVLCDKNGAFAFETTLNTGKNTFKLCYNEQTLTYTVNYRYVIIDSYYPKKSESFSSGATLLVNTLARKGSKVTATFNGKTITLKAETNSNNEQNEFVKFSGKFTLPSLNKTDLNLGKVTFKATVNGKSESFSSGKITCEKYTIPVEYNPNDKPISNRYLNVGTGKIAEIVAYEAETFDAYSTNDWSRPTNNYLPKGTVDYAAEGHVYGSDDAGKKEYVVLRYGKQVYLNRKDEPLRNTVTVTKEYAGTLPDHNEIAIADFSNNGSHTTLTLDTLWKAPFYFELKNQSYVNPSTQNYLVNNVTYTYIDITFCYANALTGVFDIPEDNPIFSSYEIIENKGTDGATADITLRLHLKEKGGFYGWDAEYNSSGQLVFSFLNPRQVAVADNKYGADLTGAVILIDVGHGGSDRGAPGFSKENCEAARNLILAKKIKAELESIGATVYMTRETDITSSNDDKIQILKVLKPDYCIAIHHNAFRTESSNGFGAYYSHPFAKIATDFVYNHTAALGDMYKKYFIKWHYYYMARSSYCPVVLTENGFISNRYDYSVIIDDNANTEKAIAITKGIADYFLHIKNS